MREPLLVPLAALAAGIACARAAPFDLGHLAGGICALGVLALLAALKKLRWAARLAAIAATMVVGTFLAEMQQAQPRPSIEVTPYETVVAEACVVDAPVAVEGRQRFLAELDDGARALVSVYMNDGERAAPVHYGQRVDLTGRLRPPRNFGNPGAFDYAAHLERKNIYWTFSVSSPGDVAVLDGDCGSPIRAGVLSIREAMLSNTESLFNGDPDVRAMINAVLLGESSLLEENWKDKYRTTGAYHTLVISGLHLSVLAAFVHLLARLMFLPTGWRIALILLVAWFYALLTGCNTPVLRAAMGLTLFLASTWFFRSRRLLNILAAVAIVFLIVDPAQLYDPSFHLSFLAVAMIGGVAVPILERTSEPWARGLKALNDGGRDLFLPPTIAARRVELRLIAETLSLLLLIPSHWVTHLTAAVLRVMVHAWELALVSAVIQVGLLLPMLAYFQQAPLAGVLLNPVVVPLTSLLVPSGLAAAVTGWEPLAFPAGALAKLSMHLVSGVAMATSPIRIPPPPFWLGALFLVTLIIAGVAVRSAGRRRIVGVMPLALATVALMTHPFPEQFVPGSLEVSAIDVGQAESLFVVFPDGTTMLIDGGGFPHWKGRPPAIDAGEDIVAPYLWSRSIRELDVVVSTHGHEDHIGGLPAIVRLFRPKEVWFGSAAGDPNTKLLRRNAARVNARRISVSRGMRREIGDVLVEVLSPEPRDQFPGPAANDDSIVLRLSYGRHSFLLCGDIEGGTESRLEATIGPSTVLKLAHHGSRTSSTTGFLAAVRPAFALVSAGYANPHRFPSAVVLERLEAFRTSILRTDRHGLATIRSDGRRITTSTWINGGER